MKTTTKLLIGLIVAIVVTIVSSILSELELFKVTSSTIKCLSIIASCVLFVALVVEIEVDE